MLVISTIESNLIDISGISAYLRNEQNKCL